MKYMTNRFFCIKLALNQYFFLPDPYILLILLFTIIIDNHLNYMKSTVFLIIFNIILNKSI